LTEESSSRIKAYIIGKAGKYRNTSLLQVLQPLFEVVEFDGFVDSSSLNAELLVDSRFFRATAYREPMAEEVACFEAHVNAWRWLVASKEDYLAVFEDDANLSLSRAAEVLFQLKQLKGPWVLTLERRFTDALLSHLLPRGNSVRRMLIQPWGSAAYIISRKAAMRALGSFSKENYVDGPVDQSAGLSLAFQYYQALPPAAAPLADVSSLMPKKPGKMRYGRRERINRVISILLSKEFGLGIKLALLKTGWFRFAKYFFSIRFATTWFSNRYGEPAWLADFKKSP
jgi:GR25 family glycosyltransferase involved in LPS biosynthesis